MLEGTLLSQSRARTSCGHSETTALAGRGQNGHHAIREASAPRRGACGLHMGDGGREGRLLSTPASACPLPSV